MVLFRKAPPQQSAAVLPAEARRDAARDTGRKSHREQGARRQASARAGAGAEMVRNGSAIGAGRGQHGEPVRGSTDIRRAAPDAVLTDKATRDRDSCSRGGQGQAAAVFGMRQRRCSGGASTSEQAQNLRMTTADGQSDEAGEERGAAAAASRQQAVAEKDSAGRPQDTCIHVAEVLRSRPLRVRRQAARNEGPAMKEEGEGDKGGG
eukprot:COSAG06_NODE_17459_length_939_cov_26.304762_1_plen_207_part_00